MTATIAGHFDDAWAGPLLDLSHDASQPLALRLAAVSAALRFPLGLAIRGDAARQLYRCSREAVPGSAERQQALVLAARVPLLSLRERLREWALDTSDPDHGHLARALEDVGDPSRIEPLLMQARAGDEGAFARLARQPLERLGLQAHALPRVTDGASPTVRFWRALALARLGESGPLDAVFAPGAQLPELFWGSPWLAWDSIASLQPAPAVLLTALDRLMREASTPARAAALGHDLHHALQLTLWAVSGQADAEGSPPRPPRPFGPVEAPAPFRTHQGMVELLTAHLATQHPAFDNAQMAWMLARTPTHTLIVETVRLARQIERPLDDRVRLLHILALAADCQADVAPLPFQGPASGGAGRAVSGTALVDDRPRTPRSARPPDRSVDVALVQHQGAEPPLEAFAEDAAQTAAVVESVAEEDAGARPDQRRVRAQIVYAGHDHPCFVEGADHLVRCWIGLPMVDGAASADQPIAHVALPSVGLALTVELLWGDQQVSGVLHLPASRHARSSECELALRVPAGERFVSADLVFRYLGRVFELVKLEAAVLPVGQPSGLRDALSLRVQLARREVLALSDAAPTQATLVWGDVPRSAAEGAAHPAAPVAGAPTLRVFGEQGTHHLRLPPPVLAIEHLHQQLFNTEKTLVRRAAAQPAAVGDAGLDTQDEEARVLLREMARFGTLLHQQWRQQGLPDPGERLQLLSLDPDAVLPLELVYDRGNPATDATLCAGWGGALNSHATTCPACGSGPLPVDPVTGLATVICPWGFWALAKVIERLNPDMAQAAGVPLAQRPALPPLDSAVFAATSQVPSQEGRAAWQHIQQTIGAGAVQAGSWPEWRRALQQPRHLLVALTHHDVAGVEDFLEIGAQGLHPDLAHLRRSQISADYVNPRQQDPGPVLLLLGCRTAAHNELGYSHVAREFQRQHASIVLGTLSQILGRHAAPLASELVSQLAAASQQATATGEPSDFGSVMRRVRRAMLARGYLLGLSLVALGDAQWRLAPAKP